MVIEVGSGRERNAAQDFSEASLAKREESFMRGDGGVRVLNGVEHRDELIGVCALIAVSANRRGDRPDGDMTILAHYACEVAKTVRCRCPGQAGGRVRSSWIVPDRVRHAQVQTVLQCIDQIPGVGGRIENPLLQSGCGLCGGMSV